jgi:hypothetical protein
MVIRSAILDRVIEPQRGSFSPEHARYVLSLGFSPEDHARYQELSTKAQEGALSEEDAAELDEFLYADTVLMILQSKARVSLQNQNPAA